MADKLDICEETAAGKDQTGVKHARAEGGRDPQGNMPFWAQ